MRASISRSVSTAAWCSAAFGIAEQPAARHPMGAAPAGLSLRISFEDMTRVGPAVLPASRLSSRVSFEDKTANLNSPLHAWPQLLASDDKKAGLPAGLPAPHAYTTY